MTLAIQTAAPFLLALILLFPQVILNSLRVSFSNALDRQLVALGVPKDKVAAACDTIWPDVSEIFSRVSAVSSIYATVLGGFLALPNTAAWKTAGGIAAILLAVAWHIWLDKIPLGSTLRVPFTEHRFLSRHTTISAGLTIAGCAAALAHAFA